MRRALSALVRLIITLRNISRLELDKDLKNKILKTYLWAIVLKRVDSTSKIANVAGYKLTYLNYGRFQYLFQEIFLDQEYYFTTANRRPLIIDCGSNIGMSILYFKLVYPNSRIIAFEPDDDAFSCLEKNIRDNDLQFVEVNKKAVSGNEGKIDFYYDIENPGSLVMSTIRERMPKQKKQVDAVHLSEYITEEVEFLKMDVEGAELGVIQELSNSGQLNYIKQMAIEYHHHIVRDEDVLSTLLHILENAGFGYQISSELRRPFDRHKFQDILIYAYRKTSV